MEYQDRHNDTVEIVIIEIQVRSVIQEKPELRYLLILSLHKVISIYQR